MHDNKDVQQIHRFQFTGNGTEYFKIWIVNILLSIVTLGIYSAWAKVRTKRYFYGNTLFDGVPFEYHATPMMILKGRVIAVLFFIIYNVISSFNVQAGLAFAALLLLVVPWIMWRSFIFNARMSSYRNVRFGFIGTLKTAYAYILLYPLLPVLAAVLLWVVISFTGVEKSVVPFFVGMLGFYLMFPWVQSLIAGYFINGSRYGQGMFKADVSARRYYVTYLRLLGVMLISMILVGLVALFIVKFFGLEATMETDSQSVIVMVMIPMYALMLIVGIFSKAFVMSSIRNYVYSKTSLDGVLRLRSRLGTGRLFNIFFTNFLMLLFTLGLAYPWAVVRLNRYIADSTDAAVRGDLAQYTTTQQKQQSAFGEELGEAFDVDMDLGF